MYEFADEKSQHSESELDARKTAYSAVHESMVLRSGKLETHLNPDIDGSLVTALLDQGTLLAKSNPSSGHLQKLKDYNSKEERDKRNK